MTNVEIITNKVLPYGKIQIVTSGISANQLLGSINNIPLSFKQDPTLGSSQVLYSMAPFLTAGIYKLSIANFNLNLEIGQIPIVSNSSVYVNNVSNNVVNLGSVLTEGGRFNNLLGSDGMDLFSKYNEVVVAFDNYIKNEATPLEIQEIANIINANALSDSNAYFFVKSDRDTIRNFFSNFNNKKIISKIISIFIEDSYAQANSQNLLKNVFYSKVIEVTKFALTLSFNTIIDGMINKCYVSKGRAIPSYVIQSENYLTFAFSISAGAILANQLGAATSYYSLISAAQALVITIGYDCEGDSTIIPKLVIQSQPITPIIPGESIDFGIKCDVGDSRYYTPGSILTRVTSKFDYISEELKETGDLIARDNLLHSCSGLGQYAIRDSQNIHCTTSLLNETLYYQNNSAQYEIIKPAQCNDGNDYYDVGTYLVSSPDFSCNFVNPENKMNIIGKSVFANQLVFDLSKKMQCPPKSNAVINYTKNNLQVSFTSSELEAPGTIFYWNFGDNPIPVRTTSRSLSHTYLYPGYYYVSVVSIDSLGNEVEAKTEVSVSSAPPPPPPPPEPPIQLEKIWFTQQGAFTQVTSVVLASPPGAGATYNWDFGDGQKEISYDGTISHWYSTSGRYILSVSVGSSIVSTVVDVFIPTLEILSQPLSMVPYGKSWDYKLKCNIGERIMMDTTVINFKTGVQIGSENVFTCSGVGQTGIGINTNQTLHTITCTPKALSCSYSFGLTIYPTFYCAVIEDGVIYPSNWTDGIAHEVDFNVPGGCNPEP